jgi:diguanylate cyclase (GGDEF)-like protein
MPAPMIRGRQRQRLAGSVSWTAFMLVLLLAGLLGALVVTLHRQEARTNRQQTAQQLRTGAQLAASALRTEQANLRTRAARLAASPALQHAVASGDRAALLKIARTSHAAIGLRGVRIGKLAAPPRLVTTIVLESQGSTAARVLLALPLRRGLLARIRGQVPLPQAATLAFAERGAAPHLESSVVAAAAVVPGVRIVAAEPRATVDARTDDYLHKLVVGALLTFLLAVVLAGRLARPLKTLVGDLSRRAERDALTGLANRRVLDERLHEEVERALRHDAQLALVLLDVDDFKRVNDRHGHQCGDDVLRAVAHVLAASVRASDVAGRFGGEEFALLLSGTGAAGAARVAEQIRGAVAELEVLTPAGEPVPVTASFGVAAFPDDAQSGERLVEHADRCLYDAKRAGKNRVVRSDRPGRAEGLAVV